MKKSTKFSAALLTVIGVLALGLAYFPYQMDRVRKMSAKFCAAVREGEKLEAFMNRASEMRMTTVLFSTIDGKFVVGFQPHEFLSSLSLSGIDLKTGKVSVLAITRFGYKASCTASFKDGRISGGAEMRNYD